MMGRPRRALADKLWLKIEYLRQAKGYSKQEFCKRIGSTVGTWNRRAYDMDFFTYREAKLISALLGIKVSNLFEDFKEVS